MIDHDQPIGPAARVTITIEIGNDPKHPHVTVNAPSGVTPIDLAHMLDAAHSYVGQMESIREYHAVQGTLPL